MTTLNRVETDRFILQCAFLNEATCTDEISDYWRALFVDSDISDTVYNNRVTQFNSRYDDYLNQQLTGTRPNASTFLVAGITRRPQPPQR